MTSYEHLQQQLKQLPGLGYRSAERIALHLLVEKPARLTALVQALEDAARTVRRCTRCGNLAEADFCPLCMDTTRDASVVCVVEHVPDLVAMERSAAYRGHYHVLHGKLSPINGVGPDELNYAPLAERVRQGQIREIILALSNDVEGEATCHFLTQQLTALQPAIQIMRIGFGLPSGAGVLYADSVTLKNALESRRNYQ